MKNASERRFGKIDWAIAAVAALAALFSYLPALAGYTCPGEMANVLCEWLGLDNAQFARYPLLKLFTPSSGTGNAVALVSGAVAAALVYSLVRLFIGARTGGEHTDGEAVQFGRIGGVVAAVAFIYTPCVFESATHLEPALFDAAWALAAVVLAAPFAKLPKSAAWTMPLLSGAMFGMGLADGLLFLAFAPLALGVFWAVASRRGGRGYAAAAVFLAGFAALSLGWAVRAVGDFSAYAKWQGEIFDRVWNTRGWYLLVLFVAAPFLVSLFSGSRAFGRERGLTGWLFHGAITMMNILAISSTLSPSSVMRPSGVQPVFTAALAAVTSGYVAAYWWSLTRAATPVNESLQPDAGKSPAGKAAWAIGWAAFGFFAFMVAVSVPLNIIAFTDTANGEFLDRVCDRIVAKMGGRDWIVTGTFAYLGQNEAIDTHLRLAAHRAGRDIHIVCLGRDDDMEYIERLAREVREAGLGGETLAAELSETLLRHPGQQRMRTSIFLQKWLSSDKEIAKKLVVFDGSDKWLDSSVPGAVSTGAVPEELFYGGGDREPEPFDWNALKPYLAPAGDSGWGSAGLFVHRELVKIPRIEAMRGLLRRHAGMIANDTGAFWQEKAIRASRSGDKAKGVECMDKAFDMYELVLDEIDADNVSALFNEYSLVLAGYPRAVAKKKRVIDALNKNKEDESRRYYIRDIGRIYGEICNPDILARQGFAFLRGGGSALSLAQINRALSLMTPAERAEHELRLLSTFYAASGDSRKERELYSGALVRDATNREALMGLSRLELLDGNFDKAREYVARAEASGVDRRTLDLQLASIELAAGNPDLAHDTAKKVTNADPSSMEAWAIQAISTMHRLDRLGEPAKDSPEEVRKADLERELEDIILPNMEKYAKSASDFHLHTVRGMMLVRKGGEDNIRGARDAFIVAARERGDAFSRGSDMILDLDMRLNDTEDAERQAVATLDRRPDDPMANYIMGSIALKKNDIASAEAYLLRSVSGDRKLPIALNDLSEVMRRTKRYAEAENYARQAVAAAPGLYVLWETLGSTLLDSGDKFDEAEQCVQKAVDLCTDPAGRVIDVRMLVSLARVQLKRGETNRAKITLRKVLGRIGELSEFERREFEELRKSAR